MILIPLKVFTKKLLTPFYS